MAHFGDFVRMRNTTIYGIAASEQRILRRPKVSTNLVLHFMCTFRGRLSACVCVVLFLALLQGFYLQLIERGWRGTMLFGLTVFSAQYFMKICDVSYDIL